MDGEQQYKDQHQTLIDEEEARKAAGEKLLSARGQANNKTDNYIDNL